MNDQSPTRLPAEALTDEQIIDLARAHAYHSVHRSNPTAAIVFQRASMIAFARAILAANAPVAQPAGAVVDATFKEFQDKMVAKWGFCHWHTRELWDALVAVPTHSPEPAGWERGRYGYTTLFNAIVASTDSRTNGSVAISVKAFEDAMLLAAPSHVAAESNE
jgi:hypothetical protein